MLWNGGPRNFKSQIWLPTFMEVLEDYKMLNIMFMGADVEGFENLGFFPQLIKHSSISDNLDKTLLSMHGIVGVFLETETHMIIP